jgi:hypothetical protein
MAAGVVKAGRKIIAMNAVFLEDREVIRVTNQSFVDIRRDDLPGNFDISLAISTAEEDNAKAQELSFMLQTVGPNAGWGVTSLILSDIARLRKMPDLAKKIADYQPEPDPRHNWKLHCCKHRSRPNKRRPRTMQPVHNSLL